jgi:curved DNA-binding protein CbpA
MDRLNGHHIEFESSRRVHIPDRCHTRIDFKERTTFCHINMDAFQILGVERQGATLKTVKKAWKNLSLIHHPDKNPHNQEEAHNIMIRINSAYQIACDILDREARNNHQLIRPNTSTHMPEETNSHQPGHSTNSSPMPEAHQPNPSGSIPRSPEATKPETL